MLFCTLVINGAHIETCNVHLANSDVAYPQLDQILELIKMRRMQPIILGDFKIYKLADRKEKSLLLHRYILSSELADYVSYPADTDSLNYIAVPILRFKLSDVKCPDTYASDHRALIATIGYAA